jgi:hypothetical protein
MMKHDVAAALVAYLKQVDGIFSHIHELSKDMSPDEARTVRRIIGRFVGDMYTDIEIEIGREFPNLRRD